MYDERQPMDRMATIVDSKTMDFVTMALLRRVSRKADIPNNVDFSS